MALSPLASRQHRAGIVTGGAASGKLSADCALEAGPQAAVGSCPASEMPPNPAKDRHERATPHSSQPADFHGPGGAAVPFARPPGQARSRWRRSRCRRSATCRSPIRRASPCPCSPSPRTRRSPTTTRPRATWSAVVSNGTAILGLGNLGALASKPVMEGKAVLFKRFADIDAFDLEVGDRRPGRGHQLRALSRTDLRRHQPRGHQGAGMLHHRGAPARAHGHPRLP